MNFEYLSIFHIYLFWRSIYLEYLSWILINLSIVWSSRCDVPTWLKRSFLLVVTKGVRCRSKFDFPWVICGKPKWTDMIWHGSVWPTTDLQLYYAIFTCVLLTIANPRAEWSVITSEYRLPHMHCSFFMFFNVFFGDPHVVQASYGPCVTEVFIPSRTPEILSYVIGFKPCHVSSRLMYPCTWDMCKQEYLPANNYTAVSIYAGI